MKIALLQNRKDPTCKVVETFLLGDGVSITDETHLALYEAGMELKVLESLYIRNSQELEYEVLQAIQKEVKV